MLASLKQTFLQKNLNPQILTISQHFASQPNKLKFLLSQLPPAINLNFAESLFRQAFVSGVNRMFVPLIIIGLISLFVILFMKTARKS